VSASGTLRAGKKETRLQRLFSTFPAGWPGVGLLLLRMAVGVTALAAGVATLADRAEATGAFVIGLLAIADGLLLLIGLFTPGAATIAGLGSAGVTLPGCPALAVSVFDARPASGFMIVMAIAILLLGPGAFSFDSYLFGRREIVIPADSRPPAR
jgi:hypothetical protein